MRQIGDAILVASAGAEGLVLTEESPVRNAADPGKDTFLDAPNVRQMHNYDCGAACTRSVAQYFKVDQGKGEDQFIKELDTEPTSKIENGTHPRAIVRWFQGNGLKAEPAENMTLDGLRKLVHGPSHHHADPGLRRPGRFQQG